MCNKSTLSPPTHHHHHRSNHSRSRRRRHRHHNNQLKPARKSRTKTRKPKFLSLSKQIKTHTTPTPTPSSTSEISEMTRHHQLNLFPLHPENQVSDDRGADENAALLFHSEAGGGGASLTGLLHSTTTTTMSSEEDSLSYVYRDDQEAAAAAVEAPDSLVKTAMRNRERDMSEEKWVCYSEVVEKKEAVELQVEADQEVTSSNETTMRKGNSLSLKLDYQGILKAWSDKGSLYIQGSDQSSPQTVPDLHDHHAPFFASDNAADLLMDGWGNAGNLWKVPERVRSGGGLKIKEEMEGKDGWKMGQREASVLRYKEKRQSRLFAKRIRYEVRKLNAEKRPRMKGRFVKIS